MLQHNRHINKYDLNSPKGTALNITSRFSVSLVKFWLKQITKCIKIVLSNWKEVSVIVISILLMILWIPVVFNKIVNFTENKASMLRQPLPHALAITLTYAVPVLELLTSILLCINSTRRLGLLFSAVLMSIFTGYVGLAVLHVWSDNLPCSCGLIAPISWKLHFWLNLEFMLLSIAGYLLTKNIKVEKARLWKPGHTPKTE